MNPKVSIAMTTYNGELYLLKQMESLISQTYTDFELIICDDCSSDNTLAILNTYASKDSRIRVIKNSENKGYARNFISVIGLCKGEYIFLADQDDIWLPNKIERMVNCMQAKQNIDLLVCKDIDFFDSQDSLKNIHQKTDSIPRKVTTKKSLLKCAYRGLNMCLRKTFIDFVLCNYDFSIPFPAHDWLFQLFATEKESIYTLSEVLTLHRKHKNNTASLGEDNSSRFSKRLSVLRKLLVHYEWACKIFHNSKLNRILRQILYFFYKRENILNGNRFLALVRCAVLRVYAIFLCFPVKWVLGDGFVKFTASGGVRNEA